MRPEREKLASKIVDNRYPEIPAESDREVLVFEVAETIPQAVFEATDQSGEPTSRHRRDLQGVHGYGAGQIAQRLGREVRQIVLAENPEKMCEKLLEGHADKQDARLAPIHCVKLLFESELDEPYTLEEVYRETKALEVAGLIYEAASAEYAQGGCLRTVRELTGWTRFELGERIGLTTKDYGSNGKKCDVLHKWETAYSAPGRDSMRKLARFSRRLERHQDDLFAREAL